jgi:pimeloyl-ACP methyl ester carboxylesterase
MSTLISNEAKHQALVNKVYQAFFSPSKYEVKPSDQEVLGRGDHYRIPFTDGELTVTVWGRRDHPAVLLMHGWGGARAQMTGFVDALLTAGYRVVAYDQPAHGDSDGRLTNILEIAPTMELLAQHEGPFEAVIAHSFGTLVTSYALTQLAFTQPAKLVYFGSFNRLLDSLPRFQVMAKLPDEIMAGLRATLYEKFGRGTLDAIVHADLVKQINIPALMYHDVTDAVTPVDDSRAIAETWSGARYIETNGLGHRGALQSDEIRGQVIDFLKS